MISYIQNLGHKQKSIAVVSYDLLCIVFCFIASHSIRFGVFLPDILTEASFITALPVVVIVQYLSLYYSNVYRAIWRFASIPDLIRVLRGVSIGVPTSLFALFLINRLEGFPRSAFLIDWLLLIFSLGGGRLLYRILSDYQLNAVLKGQDLKKVLIVGAGVGGEKLLRDIKSTPTLGIKVVGFVDDNKEKIGRTLSGIKVLGSTEDLNQLITTLDISQVFIAVPSASSQVIRDILSKIEHNEILVKTLPKLNDLIYGKIEFSQLRKIEPEDLLGRTPIKLNNEEIAAFLEGKKILVTGAGGSIGREICHQVLKHNPSQLIGFEQNELAVYELKKQFSDINTVFMIGDIRKRESIDRAVATYKPDVIFHAAAYKHVPLMEENPLEAIRTNVVGTFNTAQSAIQHHVKKFVLISTDKAINPTNVMGTTKRLTEMVCQSLDTQDRTQFVMIRFGNVLGSSGSVIPLFKEQIAKGGPVTVTHPDVIRYFMSIPEACQLVLQAGAMGIHGQVMVLDMGQPVKILDLAREMIRLAGFKPDEDIKIEFSGLRPGEKMFEEIFKDGENRIRTTNEKIFVSMTAPLSSNFQVLLNELLALNYNSLRSDVILKLKEIVPEYTPWPNIEDNSTKDANYH
jgi:FlaA1/EpsC-like NDP-sugar epimerase